MVTKFLHLDPASNLHETIDQYLYLVSRKRSGRIDRKVYGGVYRLCTWILPAILQEADPPYARTGTIISHKGKTSFAFEKRYRYSLAQFNK